MAPPVPSDIDISRAATPKPITEIAARAGIPQEFIEPYGSVKAKVKLDILQALADKPNGKYIDVTAITPTPLGEGKTTTSVGLTSLMAGTAATDFGGRKATATCSGIVDGCTYLGSAIQSFFIGYLVPSEKAGEAATFLGVTRDWHWWPIFMVPFAILGLGVAIKIWHHLPDATRRYNAEKALLKVPLANAET